VTAVMIWRCGPSLPAGMCLGDDQVFSPRARSKQPPLRCQNVYQQSWARRNCPLETPIAATKRRYGPAPSGHDRRVRPCRHDVLRRTASVCQVRLRCADSERRPTQAAVRSWVSAVRNRGSSQAGAAAPRPRPQSASAAGGRSTRSMPSMSRPQRGRSVRPTPQHRRPPSPPRATFRQRRWSA
jgi:hypothetical protein